MARDYAKRKKGSGQSRRKKRTASAGGNGWRLYAAGVVTGVFLSFMVYLNTLTPANAPSAAATPPVEEKEATPRELQFDFYDKLRERTEAPSPARQIEPARDIARPQAVETFVLQAGSFRQRDDADRRRAELLLLGLDPAIEASVGDNGRWFRVVLGPFATRAEMNRVRGLTASQNIDTLQLKRRQP